MLIAREYLLPPYIYPKRRFTETRGFYATLLEARGIDGMHNVNGWMLPTAILTQ